MALLIFFFQSAPDGVWSDFHAKFLQFAEPLMRPVVQALQFGWHALSL
jgi:hypothetical protein